MDEGLICGKKERRNMIIHFIGMRGINVILKIWFYGIEIILVYLYGVLEMRLWNSEIKRTAAVLLLQKKLVGINKKLDMTSYIKL